MPWIPLASAVVGGLMSSSSSRSNASQAADAAAQTQERNIQANRVDQINPYGSTKWSTGPDGKPTQTMTLDPSQQGLLDSRNQTGNNIGRAGANLSANMADTWSKPVNTDGLPAWQNVMGNGSQGLMSHDWLGQAGTNDAHSSGSMGWGGGRGAPGFSAGAAPAAGGGPALSTGRTYPGANGGPPGTTGGPAMREGGPALDEGLIPNPGAGGSPGMRVRQSMGNGDPGMSGGAGAPDSFGSQGGSGGAPMPASQLPQQAQQAASFSGTGGFQVPTTGPGFSSSGSSSSTTSTDPYKIRDGFDQSGVTTKLPSTIDDTSRRRVEDALMSRMNPQLQQDENSLRSRLLNSGIEVGTDAYNRELSLHGQKSNDARMQAILAGGGEESRQTQLLQGLNNQQYQQALATGKFGQDADAGMAGNATSRSNADTAASGQMGAASISSSGATERLKMELAGRASSQSADLNQRSREFNVNTGFRAAEFNNGLRNNGLQERIALRQEPLRELQSMSGLSAPTMPNFQNYYTNNAQTPATPTNNNYKDGIGLASDFNTYYKSM